MEQMHLIVYLESLGCVEEKIAKNGMYIMRNKNNNNVSAVPVASSGKNLKESTICSVCKVLGVDTPPFTSKEMEEMMNWINEDAKKRVKGGK